MERRFHMLSWPRRQQHHASVSRTTCAEYRLDRHRRRVDLRRHRTVRCGGHPSAFEQTLGVRDEDRGSGWQRSLARCGAEGLAVRTMHIRPARVSDAELLAHAEYATAAG